ncbi:GGDEF domain-containing protein [Stenotrophomonas sp. YIM B06876]|uniref:GGDEF domain-containing protein n=1 Tax=Stenotrophomonas sp. YIM B06876 TaxID=3060211 RepID=UPI002739A9F6|nr:GGDEF domain-containing protein [Stenotrophomonas sp. YIM B06876]
MKPSRDHSALSAVQRELRGAPLHTLAPVTALVLVLFGLWQGVGGHPGNAAISAVCALPAIIATLMLRQSAHRWEGAGILLCISTVLGSLLAAWWLGPTALAWSYLALMANFFIARIQVAAPANLLLVAALLATPDLLLGNPANVPGLIVIALTFGIGYHFSRRLQGDRARLEQLAALDSLTGLPNRRMLEKTLLQLIGDARADRYQHALVILDIDHFKGINDSHGHSAGDTALSDLSMILRFELREHDRVFRFGGEEFVILAHATSRENLESFTERIRKAVYQSLRGPDGRITISLGAAMYGGEKHWQDWFSRADAVLYRAKSNGRNTYVIAEDIVEEVA